VFESNGAGSELSRAQVFAQGQYPAIGRLNLATPDPNAEDAKVRVRGPGVMISTPDGQEWRMAMINPPVFPVSTPEHLVKPAGTLAEVEFLEELIRIVNEAQKRDAEDERRLYDPMLRDRPSPF
jgi:hypothetical protein